MSTDDQMFDNELANLPPEAFAYPPESNAPFEPDDRWLEDAEDWQKTTAMNEWFHARFCDPSIETPYNGREGGFLYVSGGPFHPQNELYKRFGGIVSDELINDLVDDLHNEVGEDWAPIRIDEREDEFDDRFEIPLLEASDPLARLEDRLYQVQIVLQNQGLSIARTFALKLVYSSLISSLEAFLWETAAYWVEKDPQAVRSFITKLPKLRDEKMDLGDIYERFDGLKKQVLGYLQNIVWHRWDQVVQAYQYGFDVRLPSVRIFDKALIKRHDIVHRSGHDKEGAETSITDTDVFDLSNEVRDFCRAVAKLFEDRRQGLAAGADAPDF